jgi:hypothetical protein
MNSIIVARGDVCLFFEHGMMSMHPLHTQSVERFAELCASLHMGFDARTHLLASAGFDEASWKEVEKQWMTEIAANPDGDLARRFSVAYAAARAPAVVGSSPREVAAPGSPLTNCQAPPWCTNAATVPLEAFVVVPSMLSFADEDTENSPWSSRQPFPGARDVELTAELGPCRPGPALPFLAPQGKDEESGVRAASDQPRTADPRGLARHSIDATVELSRNIRHAPALPFAAAATPVRRLHRFDSQTGLPLKTPYWVDDSAIKPNKSA